ncbi:MAG: hypothetical protein II738_05250 [Clostridia bacterium]|nr:hypothetical protein [Clostridia bacterium]
MSVVFGVGSMLLLAFFAVPFVLSLTAMIVFIVLNGKEKKKLAALRASSGPVPAPVAQPAVQPAPQPAQPTEGGDAQ